MAKNIFFKISDAKKLSRVRTKGNNEKPGLSFNKYAQAL